MWGHYGLTPEQAARGGLNPKMFNSFLDGSKPTIESTAVANATGLAVPSNGLLYPPASVDDIPFVTRPRSEGGVLEKKGMVEVIAALETDGRVIPYDIRMGVWVTVEGETEYIRNCFEEYKAHTDPSGRYFTLYKRWHLIGLEVGYSVASVMLRGEPTGVAQVLERRRGGHRQARPGSAARCSTAKAATPCGASCCRRASLAAARAACHSAWHTTCRWCGRWQGQSLSWADVAIDTAPRPTGCGARWKRRSPGTRRPRRPCRPRARTRDARVCQHQGIGQPDGAEAIGEALRLARLRVRQLALLLKHEVVPQHGVGLWGPCRRARRYFGARTPGP